MDQSKSDSLHKLSWLKGGGCVKLILISVIQEFVGGKRILIVAKNLPRK